ncbi:MAG: class I SAM-dependent DNA methyltransferase [Burkholderiales bacterium]|nr:class I SAM-dependent DNA methyltransferase [Burkholderiales bacterium]
MFERRVTFRHGDGTESAGYIDCYRRGAFVLEAKKVRKAGGGAYDDALLRARGQAEQYARALPAAEGRPPFVIVADVGGAIELYAEFSRSGATYTPYPDPRSHRIQLGDLADEAARARLRAVWLDPQSLDPTRQSAKVTREVAERLAEVARVLEAAGNAPETVAAFLSRCLFSMFAEDVGLLPKRAFVDLLESIKGNAAQVVPLVGELWRAMDRGDFSTAVRVDLIRFNGKLFKNPQVLPLTREQIEPLLSAARANWREVEPAIFGTLLERALDPAERHALGAHYTPRAYVERLVLPTIVEPLREDWKNAQAAALVLAGEGKLEEARREVREFLRRLCEVRVLDPACGSGNFLYVTLEHLKRLEGEVLNQLDELGDTQGRLELQGVSVDPHQLLGIELNPRAAEIAEMVLWIGYLQWHFRTRGQVMPPLPVLKDFHNIECRDAVLAYDRVEFVTDERGVPASRWDGKTMKKNPFTGEDVPDETARVPVERYVNARKAEWPAADFVVGNPPFIGAGSMRAALGDGYTEAVRGSWAEVSESTDFVMYWWNKAAELARSGGVRRFGFITTNSLRQTFNRRVIERHLGAKLPLSLAFVVPDHPWVDSSDGAAVRIAMTVGTTGTGPGVVLQSREEAPAGDGAVDVTFVRRVGTVNPDLTTGANVTSASALKSNASISSPGVKLHGAGFIVTQQDAMQLGLGHVRGLDHYLREYRNGRDLTDRPRNVRVIDLYGLSADEVRRRFPAVYQLVLEKVKPERDAKAHTKDGAGYARYWWIHGKPRTELRPLLASLERYIATVETAKHRTFQFLDKSILPDNMLIAIALADAYFLGVMSSVIHGIWALATGGRLGVGNDPRYNKTRCFETFPFPAANPEQQARIRDLAEQLDAHRKRQQAQHPDLTLTGMYNVLEKLKIGEPLTAKEKVIHEQGLVAVLKTLHGELDRVVLAAYGWGDLVPLLEVVNGNAPPPQPSPARGEGAGTAARGEGGESGAREAGGALSSREEAKRALDDALLERLVALNAERAAEEKRGLVRWLRPEFQIPASGKPQAPAPEQAEIDVGEKTAPAAPAKRRPWPATLPEQVKAVGEVLAAARGPMNEDAIAANFAGRGPWRRRLPQIVETLVAVGRVRRGRDGVAVTA